MSEQNRTNQQSQEQTQPAPAKKEETRHAAPAWKKFLGKKWVYPATYMVAAAIILSLVWAYQESGKNKAETEDGGLTVDQSGITADGGQTDDPTLPASAGTETMIWPVADPSAVEVAMPYFDSEADAEARQAAIVQYGNEFYTNMGLVLVKPDNTTFDVLAAMSGTVTRAEKLPIVGNVVEITHKDGLKTYYQSLSNVSVSLNEQVKQGQVIGQAGRNELEKDFGVHLHFEVLDQDEPVNPESYLPMIGDAAAGAAEDAEADSAADVDAAAKPSDAGDETGEAVADTDHEGSHEDGHASIE
jgi:stage II sporulation protein Q